MYTSFLSSWFLSIVLQLDHFGLNSSIGKKLKKIRNKIYLFPWVIKYDWNRIESPALDVILPIIIIMEKRLLFSLGKLIS